jgi:hypothetical protein
MDRDYYDPRGPSIVLEVSLAARADAELDAFLAEHLRHGAAEAFAGASDHRNFTCESEAMLHRSRDVCFLFTAFVSEAPMP